MKIVNYEERFGAVLFPEGFEETLKNLTIEEQMKCYRVIETSSYSMTDWRERLHTIGYAIDKCYDVKSVIVKDGIVVGVMIVCDTGSEVACLPEERVCTYYADDNNGAGSKCRIDYLYLHCVPYIK